VDLLHEQKRGRGGPAHRKLENLGTTPLKILVNQNFDPFPFLKAVAHKLARACFYIMRDEVVFEVDRAFA